MADDVLLTDVTDGIATITLNRPERRNALNGALIAALDAAVQAMAADDGVRVVVLTGAPAEGALGGFCSGGDVKGGGREPGGELAVPDGALDGDLGRHDRHPALLLHVMPKPTIAMIGGPAIGAGASLAAACDLRYASEDALFAAGFAPNGLTGDYGGSFHWTRIMGTARAREFYFLNERVTAMRALELGMVHEVVPASELRDRTLAVARKLVQLRPSVLARIKDNLNAAEDEVDRRRFLFAHEAANQIASVRRPAR